MGIKDVKWLDMPTFRDGRGALSFAETGKPLPFAPQRIFYMYDVPGQLMRGGHAHKTIEQVIMAISGSFKLGLDDGQNRETYELDSPQKALYVPSLIWDELYQFTPGTICLVLASQPYDEADYIRNYPEFINLIKSQS